VSITDDLVIDLSPNKLEKLVLSEATRSIQLRADLRRYIQPGVLATREGEVVWEIMTELDATVGDNYISPMHLINALMARKIDGRNGLDWFGADRVMAYDAAQAASRRSVLAAAAKLRKLWKSRRIVTGVTSVIKGMDATKDPDRIIDELRLLISELEQEQDDIRSRHASVIADAVRKHVGKHYNPETADDVQRMMCDIEPVDALIDGFEQGKYVVLSSYSKHGKTSLASAIMAGLANNGAVVNIHQCEVADLTQAARLMCGHMQTKFLRQNWIRKPDRIDTRNRTVFLEKLGEALDWLGGQDIYFEMPGIIEIEHIEQRARLLKRMHPDRPVVIMVDYLQKISMRERATSRQDTLRRISERLIDLAKREDVLIFALSQYTDDGVQSIPVAQPLASQTRGSKSIRDDVDLLLTWHRPWWSDNDKGKFGILEVAAGREHEPYHVAVQMDLGCGSIEWSRQSAAVPQLGTQRLDRDGNIHNPIPVERKGRNR